MKIKKTLLILTSILLSVSLFACSSPYLPIVEEYSETGINVFNMNLLIDFLKIHRSKK